MFTCVLKEEYNGNYRYIQHVWIMGSCCNCALWMAKFSSDQIAAAREERQKEAELHKQEVDALAEVIQKNTDAINKLTAYITKEVIDCE